MRGPDRMGPKMVFGGRRPPWGEGVLAPPLRHVPAGVGVAPHPVPGSSQARRRWSREPPGRGFKLLERLLLDQILYLYFFFVLSFFFFF